MEARYDSCQGGYSICDSDREAPITGNAEVEEGVEKRTKSTNTVDYIPNLSKLALHISITDQRNCLGIESNEALQCLKSWIGMGEFSNI